HPVPQAPLLAAVDSEHRDRPGIRGVLSAVPEAPASAAAATPVTTQDPDVNPGLTPEPGQAAQEDTYPLGLSSDAGDRPCPRQKRAFTLSASLHKHTVSRSSGGLCY